MAQSQSMTPLVFMQEILANRLRWDVSTADINALIQQGTTLKKLSDRGIFILLVAQLLRRQYASHQIGLRKFASQFEAKEKKIRVRDGASPRKKKHQARKQNRPANGAMTLEELSEESASHPSNVEKGRLIDVRLKEDVASNGVKSKSSQNGSEDSQNQHFGKELTKISEDIRMNEETNYAQHEHFTDLDVEQSSNSSVGLIHHLADKMKIIGEVSFDRRIATRKKVGPARGAALSTRRKQIHSVIDQHTILEETRASFDDSADTKASYEFVPSINTYQQFNQEVGEKQIEIFPTSALLNNDNLIRLKEFSRLEVPKPPQNYLMQVISSQFYTDDNELLDYTLSQENKGDSYKTLSFSRFERDKLPSSLFENASLELSEMSAKLGVKKSSFFYQLLWRCQNGECTIEQKNPELFGPIYINK